MTAPDLRLNGTVIRFDADILPQMEPRLFDPDWLRAHQHWQGASKGRSEAHFFHYAGHDMVLRHFQRGGLVGRVIRDLYLRVGAGQSRAFREFDLLRVLRSEGLPVPAPVAARFVPAGLFYRADIITRAIPQARPLQEVLCEAPLPAPVWRAIGAAVRRLHDHGVFHSDLNCRNILMDADNRVWIIDFDKCDKRAPGGWTQTNLDRLQRSLIKTAGMQAGFHWQQADWAALLAGYADAT